LLDSAEHDCGIIVRHSKSLICRTYASELSLIIFLNLTIYYLKFALFFLHQLWQMLFCSFFIVDSLVSFNGTFVTGNQLATGPINGQIIMTKYPPGIVFIFHNCVDCIQSNNSFSQSNSLLYANIENNFYSILLKCSQAEQFSFALTFPNVFFWNNLYIFNMIFDNHSAQ
jgi:hypothetical protein